MTHWMTAAGLALIAGGLAVLIGFRHVLLSRDGNRTAGSRRRTRTPRAIEPARRPALSATAAPLPQPEMRAAEVPGPRRRVAVRSATTVVADRPHVEVEPTAVAERPHVEVEPVVAERDEPAPARRPQGGLALLGLADDEPETEEPENGELADEELAPADGAPANGELADGELADGELAHGELAAAVPADGGLADGESADGESADAEENSGAVVTADEVPDEPSLPEDAGSDEQMPVVDGPVAEAADDLPEPAEQRAGGNRFAADDGSGEAARFEAVPQRAGGAAPRVERYGDRIDGWIRPQYQEQYEPGGDYWTPVPESSYADAGYGWPVPVERLPPVPSYQPQSGFEPVDEPQPTALVPQWPPAKPSERIELPRTWAARDTKAQPAGRRDARDRPEAPGLDWVARDRNPEGRSRRGAITIDRRRSADTEMLPAVDETAPAVPRRRPRPRPSQPDQQSTVYRSRHAADPS